MSEPEFLLRPPPPLQSFLVRSRLVFSVMSFPDVLALLLLYTMDTSLATLTEEELLSSLICETSRGRLIGGGGMISSSSSTLSRLSSSSSSRVVVIEMSGGKLSIAGCKPGRGRSLGNGGNDILWDVFSENNTKFVNKSQICVTLVL